MDFVPLLILAPDQPELCTPCRHVLRLPVVHALAPHGGARAGALVVLHVRRPRVPHDAARSGSRNRVSRTAPTVAFL